MAQQLAPIILVEDDEDDVEFVRRALKTRRVLNPVLVIPDVESAKAYFRRAIRTGELPVVTIIDIYLPAGQTGLDLLTWMREQPQLAESAAIILSVSTDRTHEARARGSNAALVLHKPITPGLLVDAIGGLNVAMTYTSIEGRSGIAIEGRSQ